MNKDLEQFAASLIALVRDAEAADEMHQDLQHVNRMLLLSERSLAQTQDRLTGAARIIRDLALQPNLHSVEMGGEPALECRYCGNWTWGTDLQQHGDQCLWAQATQWVQQ